MGLHFHLKKKVLPLLLFYHKHFQKVFGNRKELYSKGTHETDHIMMKLVSAGRSWNSVTSTKTKVQQS